MGCQKRFPLSASRDTTVTRHRYRMFLASRKPSTWCRWSCTVAQCRGTSGQHVLFRQHRRLTRKRILKKKSKGLPQTAEVAQGVPGRLRPRIFLTFRHYKGGRSSAKSTGRLYPRWNPWYSLSEAESTSGHMVLSVEPRKKSSVTPPGIDPATVRLVTQCLNHYATLAPPRKHILLPVN